MVVACAAAIWLIGRLAGFTGAGKAVSDGITQALNVAFAKLPAAIRAAASRWARPTANPGAGQLQLLLRHPAS